MSLFLHLWLLAALVQLSCGVSYRIYNNPVDQQQASDDCGLLGGVLAMPKSAAEQQRIVNAVKRAGGNGNYWMDLSRSEGFVWGDGEALGDWNSWGNFQPGDNGDCVTLAVEDGKIIWYTNNCSEKNDFICQFEEHSFPKKYKVPVLIMVDKEAHEIFEAKSGRGDMEDFITRSFNFSNKRKFKKVNIKLNLEATIILNENPIREGNKTEMMNQVENFLDGKSDGRQHITIFLTGLDIIGADGFAYKNSYCSRDHTVVLEEFNFHLSDANKELLKVLGACGDSFSRRSATDMRSLLDYNLNDSCF